MAPVNSGIQTSRGLKERKMCPGQCCSSLCPSQHPSQSSVLASTQRETFWEHGSCKCTLSREFRLQASWHHHQQQRQKLFMPRHSSAARSGNLHKWQLMGKRPQCHPSSAPTLQRKGSHSLPQICTAPTVLRQKGPKPAAKNYLRDGRQWQGSSPWNGFIVERLSSLHWWEPYFKAIWPGLQTL